MKDIMLFKDVVNCCACGACLNECPMGAIDMKYNEEGFLYPRINKALCIGCGKCTKVCAYQNDIYKLCSPKKIYAAISNNTDLKKSASGGVFASLAKEMILQGGIVYGVSYVETEDGLSVRHTCVGNIDQLESILGSKYIQSHAEKVFREVRTHLKAGKKVLFSGTPCQVAALKAFVKNDYASLFTIDIICHGVPSDKWFSEYIELIEKKFSIKIRKFIFRDKTTGWGLRGKYEYELTTGKRKQKSFITQESSYYYLFLQNIIDRPNCYTCKYASSKRTGDITIGDYWGIEKEHGREILDNNIIVKNGVSCLLVNNSRGEELISKFGTKLRLINSTFEQVARYNEQLNKPSKPRGDREKILNIYRQLGYKGVENYFQNEMKFKIFVVKVLNKLPLSVRQFLKNAYKNIRLLRSR